MNEASGWLFPASLSSTKFRFSVRAGKTTHPIGAWACVVKRKRSLRVPHERNSPDDDEQQSPPASRFSTKCSGPLLRAKTYKSERMEDQGKCELQSLPIKQAMRQNSISRRG